MKRLDRKKEKTKQAIITATMSLIQENGFDGTTMEKIAEEADIAKGTLYNYFPVKEAIISEWIRRTSIKKNEEQLKVLPTMPNTRERLIAVFESYMIGVQKQKDLFEKYVVYQMQELVSFDQSNTKRSGLANMGAEIIRLGQQTGEIRKDIPEGILQDMFEVIFIEIVKEFYKSPSTFQSQETINKMVDMFLNGAKDE